MARKEIAPENTAVIYARYSSTNQREESIEAQVRACQEYAKRTGLQIIDIYADSAKTGTNAERENFQRMIEDSSKGKFRFVIIHKLDRFSRDRYDSVTYKRKLKINGVILRSVLENLDGSPESQILESLLEGMAAYYSQNLSRECLKGLLENGHKCLHNGGIPPLGYDVDKATRNYVVNEQEAEIVRFIFANYAEGIGYNQILKQLNTMGHHSKRGREFGKNSLHDLLKNERYTGIYTFNLRLEKDLAGNRNPQFKPKEEWIYIEGGMPAIIDRETFDKVQIRLANNKKNGGHFKTKRVYMLAGILKCGACGAPMYGNSHIDGRHGKEYLAYECSGKAYKKICDSKGVRKENIENYVLEQLQNNLFSAGSMAKLSKMLCEYGKKMQEESKGDFEDAVRELEETNKRIEKIVELVSESGISIETVREELKRLEEKKRTTEGTIHELGIRNNAKNMSEETIRAMIGKSKELVEARNISECRKIVSNFVESVVVHRDSVKIQFKINVPDEANKLTPLTRIDELSVIKECKKTG
jgi:site-specific DNA recombinase